MVYVSPLDPFNSTYNYTALLVLQESVGWYSNEASSFQIVFYRYHSPCVYRYMGETPS